MHTIVHLSSCVYIKGGGVAGHETTHFLVDFNKTIRGQYSPSCVGLAPPTESSISFLCFWISSSADHYVIMTQYIETIQTITTL
jgi:hypothetical protein